MIGPASIFRKNLEAIYSLFGVAIPVIKNSAGWSSLGVSAEEKICSQLELKSVAHLSLEERSAKYSIQHNQKIARHQLRVIYAEHGIRKKVIAKRWANDLRIF